MDASRDQLRVGFISQWFPPEPVVVPASIFDALASEFDTVAITGQPNYPEGALHDGFRAYGNSYALEGGRKVRRTPVYPDHSSSVIGRILNYCSWAASATLFARREVSQTDVNFVYASPIMAALPAMAAKVTHGIPFVLNIQDLWPDSVFATGFITDGPLRKVAEWSVGSFADLAYRMASAVITISPGMGGVLEERGVDPSKIHLVYNWADESILEKNADALDDSRDTVRSELGLSPLSRVLAYAGNVGPAQGLHHVVEALSLLTEEKDDCHLVIIGDGVELPRVKLLVEALSLEKRVTFVGRVPSTQVPRFLRAADASLVSLGDSELFRHTMPSKVQAILASGSPIFVVGQGDVAQVATRSGAGWATTSEPESLVNALRAFAADDEGPARGEAAAAFYFSEMSRSIGTQRLASVLREATGHAI